MSFSQALFQYQYPEVAYLMLGLMAISGILSVVGGGLFVLQVVASVLFGKRKDPVTKSAVPLIAEPVAAGVQGIGIGGISVPGTLVLALVFLTAFILYYFINWKYLSQVWGLS
jgi:cytochrome c oxidase subunit 1